MTTAVTAASQRRRRTHPLVVLLRWLVVLTLIAAVIAATAIAFAPAPRVGATPLALPAPAGEPATITWPEGTARAAGFAVAGVDGSAEAWGEAEAVPMASLTKLITALVVLEAHPLSGSDRGAEVTLGRADINALGAAVAEAAPTVPVFDGMVVEQRDLLEWSLVDSAANASWSLANWAFGSIEAFVAAANDWAERNELDTTVVADPSGLELESRASAADMVELGLLSVAHPVVLETIGMARVDVPGGSAANTNPILGEGFVDGGKTGTLFVSGRNLLVTAERDIEGEPRRIVAVVLGVVAQDDLNAATLALVDSLWDDFGTTEVLPEGTPAIEYRAPWGASVTAATVAPLASDAFAQHLPAAALELQGSGDIEVGGARGEVASVRVTDAFGAVTQVPVRTEGMLAGPDIGWRFAHPADVLGWYLG
ncbi:D-alanyl-D-alanine carboxypeptidase family protein [Agrococcus sp. Marseille-P2731]|uniref:D-alanyl-D-alanine carboxypeptidase family protein n=1 Tax=Agrococcus sp. Marseille-P2731 TaxID=1841862 RepID=UPI0011609ED9|nr:D-alanyl-D-alanine carboxypeptidase [Agrococcus sp. Marseille-P2731]